MTKTQTVWYWVIMIPMLYGAVGFLTFSISQSVRELGYKVHKWLLSPNKWVVWSIVYAPLLSVLLILFYICSS